MKTRYIAEKTWVAGRSAGSIREKIEGSVVQKTIILLEARKIEKPKEFPSIEN
jgi:hypothetical protein